MNRMSRAVRSMILSLVFFSCMHIGAPETSAQRLATEEVRDLARFFKGMNGSFVLFDAKANCYVRHNPEQCARRFSPASTFKILNSLIGLETGVIPDEHYVIPWDSVRRTVPDWNRSHDMESAIRYSVVWYYQELARRVGVERMSKYVRESDYGNQDVSGPLDRFWLGSTLLISANEQVGFLRKLHDNNLPFSQRALGIVKRILILDHTGVYTLRAKTGYAVDDRGVGAGWFVGYVERGEQIYYFATTIVTKQPERDTDRIMTSREPITLAILKELGIL